MSGNNANRRQDCETAILATVTTFLSSLGDHRDLFASINLESFYVSSCASPGHATLHSTLAQYVSRVDDEFDNFYILMGAKTAHIEILDNPHQRIWVYADLAAVWTDSRTMLDGREHSTAVNLFTLHLYGDSWKISAMASEQLSPENHNYEITTGSPEVIKPINSLLDHLTNQNWDGLLSTLMLGGGATLFRPVPPGPASTTTKLVLDFSAFVHRLKAVFAGQPEAKMEKKIFDVGTRYASGTGFAFAWTPIVVEVNGIASSCGTNVFTLFRQGDKNGNNWRVTGIQDTSRPV